MAQGKAWNREEVTETLKPFFQLGYSVRKACEYAGIAQQTVDTWIQNDEELRLKIIAWQHEIDTEARKVIKEKIGTEKDVNTATWWAERKEKDEFSIRQENINTNVTLQDIMSQFEKPANSNFNILPNEVNRPISHKEQAGSEGSLPDEQSSEGLRTTPDQQGLDSESKTDGVQHSDSTPEVGEGSANS
jgi:hypothetical protein